jgi:hypothetical protein
MAFMSGVTVNVAAIFRSVRRHRLTGGGTGVLPDRVGGDRADLGHAVSMRESDEFVRAVVAKQFILAAGLAMAVASVWGFGRLRRSAAHSARMIYPLFWACFGVSTPFVKSSN